MQIQKGLVKYKDRTDIVCTYGLTEDGKQYYFLDEGSIPNGNIIASTALVEAIDPVVAATAVGVIDREGNIVIPFENKSIKAIGEKILLVERAVAVTPSVVEAVKLRSDPLAATKLVTTPATIKDNMNARMGNEGRFIFNDQFSEATVCDIDGKNLINDEYYSFIGINNSGTLYFSKNTVDSSVIEFKLPVQEQVEVPLPSKEEDKLDVEKTEVTKSIIDEAMTGDITADVFENLASNEEQQVIMNDSDTNLGENTNTIFEEQNATITATNEETNEDMETDKVLNSGFSPADVASDISNSQIETPVTNVKELGKDVDVNDEQKDLSSTDEEVEEKEVDSYAPTEEAIELPINVSSDIKSEVEEASDSVTEKKSDKTKIEEDLAKFDFKDDNTNKSELESNDDSVEKSLDKIDDFKNDLFAVDLDTDIFADSDFHADKIVSDSLDDTSLKLSSKDTIIEDVAATLSNLIKLNKAQKEKITAYEEKFEQIVTTHKSVVEKARNQVREMEVLKSKVKNYETIVSKLENKIQNLEDKVHNQDRLITSQTNELDTLRPQVEGKRELARILADAQDLLEHVE